MPGYGLRYFKQYKSKSLAELVPDNIFHQVKRSIDLRLVFKLELLSIPDFYNRLRLFFQKVVNIG
jgi:hypothetical protein